MTTEAICALVCAVLVIALLIDRYIRDTAHDKTITAMNKAFDEERNRLLDRLQARDFNEYKSGEIRMTKAMQKEQPKEQFGMELL